MIGNNKAWFGNSANKATEIMVPANIRGNIEIDVHNFIYKDTYKNDVGPWPNVFGSNRYMCWYKDMPGYPKVIMLWNNNSYQVVWGLYGDAAREMGATDISQIKAEGKRVYFAYNTGSSVLSNIPVLLITFYYK